MGHIARGGAFCLSADLLRGVNLARSFSLLLGGWILAVRGLPSGGKNLGFFDLGVEKALFQPWACPPGEKKLGFFDLGSEKSLFRF